MSANYWIAQYVGDPFRREPRNVGVFVELDGAFDARFLGVGEQGQVDGRKLRNRIEYPDVYKQWVAFWSDEIRRGTMTDVLSSNGTHYRVVDGGVVDDVGIGELDEVVGYLYSLLVTERGPREPFGIADDELPASNLVNEVVEAFKNEHILATGASPLVPFPVRRSVPIIGKLNVEYRPAFTQENGRLYIMETIDFTVTRKKPMRDHAGWTAYVFSDIKALGGKNREPISIVKVTEQDATEDEDVRSGMAFLNNESEVINWLDESQRAAFLSDRLKVARSSHEIDET